MLQLDIGVNNKELVNKVTWGYYSQGSPELQKIERLGAKLSVAISCPVHYPAFGKRLFECEHGVIFPVFVVESMSDMEVKEKHDGERKYCEARL